MCIWDWRGTGSVGGWSVHGRGWVTGLESGSYSLSIGDGQEQNPTGQQFCGTSKIFKDVSTPATAECSG